MNNSFLVTIYDHFLPMTLLLMALSSNGISFKRYFNYCRELLLRLIYGFDIDLFSYNIAAPHPHQSL